MHLKNKIATTYMEKSHLIDELISEFEKYEDFPGTGERNRIKSAQLDGTQVIIKSFKIPNVLNQIVYRFFRKSKAQRSFEYAVNLGRLGIGTPAPVAYFTFGNGLLFKRSYYICEYLDYDLTYRELTENLNYPDHEAILRAFTSFTWKLHENNVEFLDHSPGNTLIKKKDEEYHFFLVDLNRMRFRTLSLEDRIRNFSRLTPYKSVVSTMSDEYAKCMDEDPEKIFKLMWQYTEEFQGKYWRKQRLKKRLRFWKTKHAN